MIAELLRRWLGIVEAEEDMCEAVARLHLRVQQLEQQVQRLQPPHMDELERRRFMRGWVQRHDPGGAS